MRRTVSLTAAAVALAAVVGAPAHAQDACGEYTKSPPVGGWGEYQILKKDKPDGTLRFAIVGTEQRAGKEMQWFEMTMTGKKNERTVMKALIPGYPYEPDGIEELIMKTGDEPAMDMSGPMMGMMKKNMGKNARISIAEECKKMKLVGEESITVPAGTFDTRHYRDAEGSEVWISDDLPFGMVKTTDGKDFEMQLAAHGDGAKTAITETPKKMFGGS